MKLYSETKDYKLYHGNMLDMLEHIQPNTIDSIVTDPPYELNFMNKGWDNSGIAFQKDTWAKCFEVLKPGGYLLAFGGSRTFHRIACAIEDAGFEIRDTIMWLYGSGFPKSMNIGLAIDKKNGVESPVVGQNQDILKKQAKDLREGHRKIVDSLNSGSQDRNNGFKTVSADIKEPQNEWKGWGTCLKPSFEPIIVARKPFKGSLVDNIMEYGVGGLNIDECRVGVEERTYRGCGASPSKIDNQTRGCTGIGMLNGGGKDLEFTVNGRFPANTILTYDETDYEEVRGGFPIGGKNGSITKEYKINNQVFGEYGYCHTWNAYNDEGSASRYFYCAKASKKDRDEGLDNLESKQRFQQGNYSQSPVCSVCGKTFNGTNNHSMCGEHTMIYKSKEENMVRKNIHPTVKPTDLMQYLIRLVTPNGGTVLDPFNGSGSTGKATMYENRERNKGYKYIGIELTEEYLPIAKARIEYPLTCILHNDKKETKIKEQPIVEQNKEVNLW